MKEVQTHHAAIECSMKATQKILWNFLSQSLRPPIVEVKTFFPPHFTHLITHTRSEYVMDVYKNEVAVGWGVEGDGVRG